MYYYDGELVFSQDVTVYPQGKIPESVYGQIFFKTPAPGLLYSMIQPETNSYTAYTTGATYVYDVRAPKSLVTTNAMTGFSWMLPFNGHPTEDQGYLKFFINAPVIPPPVDD
jgi:hypothetical protein